MTLVIPQCLSCKHFIDDKSFTCAAFKDAIPNEILTNEHDHKEEFPGDNGIRFEEVESTPGESND
jgi:hypothetical protein